MGRTLTLVKAEESDLVDKEVVMTYFHYEGGQDRLVITLPTGRVVEIVADGMDIYVPLGQPRWVPAPPPPRPPEETPDMMPQANPPLAAADFDPLGARKPIGYVDVKPRE